MPAIGQKGFAEISMRDATAEVTTARIRIAQLTAANLAAQLVAQSAFDAAVAAIVLGVVSKETMGNAQIISNAEASDPSAQRESKLLVSYWDATTEQIYSITIGTIDYSLLVFMPGAGDAVAFTTAQGAPTAITDFVTAFEAFALAPDTGNAVAVIGMRFVGRST